LSRKRKILYFKRSRKNKLILALRTLDHKEKSRNVGTTPKDLK